MPGFDVGSGVCGRGCDRVNEAAPPAADALRLQLSFFCCFFLLRCLVMIRVSCRIWSQIMTPLVSVEEEELAGGLRRGRA